MIHTLVLLETYLEELRSEYKLKEIEYTVLRQRNDTVNAVTLFGKLVMLDQVIRRLDVLLNMKSHNRGGF